MNIAKLSEAITGYTEFKKTADMIDDFFIAKYGMSIWQNGESWCVFKNEPVQNNIVHSAYSYADALKWLLNYTPIAADDASLAHQLDELTQRMNKQEGEL